MRNELVNAGALETTSHQDADLTIIMTCGFTTERQVESLREIKAAVQNQLGRRVVVSGCLPDINEGSLQGLGDFQVLRPRQIGEPDLIAKLWPAFRGQAERQPAIAADRPLHRVRVSRGCMGKCSFCAIPRATGPLASRPASDIYDEVSRIVGAGGRKILLAGEDVGAYGRDQNSSLGALLELLLSIHGEFELVVESINPQWLGLLLDEFPCLVSEPRISRRWYVPVQAGSDHLLRIMRRPYNVARAASSLHRLRELRPDLYLISDVIVGHPGETHQDLLASAHFLDRHQIDYAEIMRFNAHPGTAASALPDQISAAEAQLRAEYLVLVFIRTLIEKATRAGATRLSTDFARHGTLPINTNIDFASLPSYIRLAAANYESPTEGTRTIHDDVSGRSMLQSETGRLLLNEMRITCGQFNLTPQFFSQLIRKMPQPKAVALAFPDQAATGGNAGRRNLEV